MAKFTVGSVSDTSATTVADLIGDPLLIPARILEMLDNSFLTDVIFRDAGGNGAGVLVFEEGTPLFLAGDPEDIAEYAEIPVSVGQRGSPRVAVGVKRGLGVRVSREMRDENRFDEVARQLIQLRNTMVRAEERALRSLLLSTTIPGVTAAATWGTTGKPRYDTASAMEVIASAVPAGATTEDILGFEPDTIIMPGAITPVLMNNTDFLSVYAGGANSAEDIRYTGRLPGTFMGLTALRTRFGWPANKALVLQRGILGLRSDTRPLEATPMYPEGNGPNGGPTESWRSDTTRKRVLGVDQPLAACWINGI
jgi:hypothetical protein